MRSLGYLKLLVETMLVSVDYPKHQVLCCSGSAHWCSPQVPGDEDILGLAYSEADLQSVENLSLEGNLLMTRSYKKLKTYKPFVSVKSAWRKETTKKVVALLCKELHQVRGDVETLDERPMMFLPGRVVHLEDSSHYEANR